MDYTVGEYIELLQELPAEAIVDIQYTGHYDAEGGVVCPYLQGGNVIIGKLKACWWTEQDREMKDTSY